MLYIDKEQALSFPFANGQYDKEHANENFIFGCETYKEWLENLPVVDVQEVKHAKWKDECCTNCGTSKFVMKAVRGFDEVIYEYEGEANYCPNCGAKMDGRENEI